MSFKLGSTLSLRRVAPRPLLAPVIMLVLSLSLAACGQDPTPGPPPAPTIPPTPPARFQLATEQRLLFSMNVPNGWTRTDLDSTSVVWTNPTDTNLAIGVVSRGNIPRLTAESQRFVQERVDQLKARTPSLKEDPNNGSLSLAGNSLPVDRLTYTNTLGVNVYQYLTEANNVGAERAYILFAVTPVAVVETYRPLYLDAFRSFISLAGGVARVDESLNDPTVTAAINGGVVRPNGPEIKVNYSLSLVEWETPPLNARLKTPRLYGKFPLEYKWRLRPFPSQDQPAIYLESPRVDKNTSEAIMQIGIYKDALPAGSPSADAWSKFYQPALDRVVNLTLKSYAPNVSIDELEPTPAPPPNAKFYRVHFTARDDSGEVQARGIVLFGKYDTHGITGVLSLSPYTSLKQEVVDNFTGGFETIMDSISIKY